ncbi:hypothetical protein TKK_0017895 [Trichogramma kaykai]
MMAQPSNVTNNLDNTESIRRVMSFLAQELSDFQNWAENMMSKLKSGEYSTFERYELQQRMVYAEMLWMDFMEKKRSLLQSGDSVPSDLNKQAGHSYFRGSAIAEKCKTTIQKLSFFYSFEIPVADLEAIDVSGSSTRT